MLDNLLSLTGNLIGKVKIMNKSRSVTQQDIARRLNLSKVSVSKALRDQDDISPATKELIRKTAIEMGYMPNLQARNLAEGRSRTLGVVIPKIAHNFFSAVIESIYTTASAQGYEVVLTISQEDAEHEKKHFETLMGMRVDGILCSVSEATKDTEIFEAVRKRGVPLVFFDRELAGLGFSSVVCNDDKGAYDATTYLIGRGYKRITHIAGYSETNIGQQRIAGFKRAMADNNLELNEFSIIERGFSEKDGVAGFEQLAKAPEYPDAIFAVTYPVALGIYSAAREVGLDLPKDIDLICFGANERTKFVTPSISYIRQPAELMGQRATEVLLQEIREPALREEHREVLDTELVPCGDCPDK
mgnify:CR=1 FL=1